MGNWAIGGHYDDNSEENDFVYTTFNPDNKRADIFLCSNWEISEKIKYELNKIEFHEVSEVLLFKLRYLAGKREYSYDEVDGEIYSVIRILTAKIFENLSK